jgi:hypothetical protein
VSEESAFEKHSVTLPGATSRAVRDRVGARGFSAYVATAVERQLRRDALRELVERMEAEHGPADETEVAAISERMGWS